MKMLLTVLMTISASVQAAPSLADDLNGRNLYAHRCSMCHGADLKATGRLADKSNPPTPDLTTLAFKRRLTSYPGIIVSSVVLRPNGDLIPNTLRNNGVRLPPHAWTVKDLQDVDQYMKGVIRRSR